MITENKIKGLHLFTGFKFARLLKSILLILFFSQLVYSYVANTYEIKDLETNDERFKSEVQAWSTSPLGLSNQYTLCGGFYILGGLNVLSGTGKTTFGNHYYMRTYYNLPSHTRLYFSFQLWMIDSWDIEDIVEIKLDSKVFNGWILDTYSIRYMLSNQCGASNYGDVGCIKVSGSASHVDSSLTFAVISKADQTTDDESLGIRNVVLYFAKTSNLTSDVICGNAGISLNTQQCPCPDGNYLNGSTCSACNYSCASCFGPSANECYRCNEGYSFDGIGCLACDDNCVTCDVASSNKCISCKSGYVLLDNSKCIPQGSCSSPLVFVSSSGVCVSPCSDKSYFLYWNGGCYPTCNPPLKPGYLLGTVTYCRNPCLNAYCSSYSGNACIAWGDYYLYWDGECRTSCNSPFNATYQYGRYFCNFPCGNPNDFLYWNGSCLSTCGNLLISKTTYGGQFKLCEFPCGDQYLYWNGSCGNTCRYPLKVKIEGGKYYCTRPCNSGEYLYLNNTCSPNPCENRFQLVNLTESVPLCVSICDGGPPYLYYDNTCRGNCLPPLTPGNEYGLITCDYICASHQYLYWNGSCLEKCNFPLVNRTEGGALFCDYPCPSIGDYLYWNGSCKSTCDTLFKIRIETDMRYCDMPCKTNEYLYWNGSCLQSCSAPLVHQYQSPIKYCIYPCSIDEYLYWNTSCKPTCAYPSRWKIESSRKFCNLKCHPDDFLYWSESCNSSCNFPLTHRVLDNVKLCEYPCLISQYLYWNGTCANSCLSYYNLLVFETRNFCNPSCPLDEFFYVERKMCVKKCPLRFFGSNITKLCQNCTDSLCSVCLDENSCESCLEGAILDINNICRTCNEARITYLKSITKGHQYRLQLLPTSCDLDESTVELNLKGLTSSIFNFPSFALKVIKLQSNFYQVDLILEGPIFEEQNLNITLFYLDATIKVPKKFVPSPLMEEIAQHTETAQTTVDSFIGVSLGGTLAIGAAAAMWSFLGFQQFIGYFTYLNVEYPPQVKIFLSMSKSIDWNILPNPLAALTSRWSKDILGSKDPLIDNYNFPQKFLDDDQKKPFFIEKGGSIIALNIGLLLILGLVKLKKTLKWNVIIRTFLSNGIQLSLAIFLQLRCFSFENIYLASCTILALFSLAFQIIMSLSLIKVMRKHKKTHLKERRIQELYGTLYEGMDLAKVAGRYYHIIILFRGIVFILLVTLFENYPLLQTSILIYMNAGLVYFLFNKARFLNRKLNTINRIKEVLILVAEICILFLQFQIDSIKYYDICGWIMVGSLGLSLIIEALYTFVIQLMEIKTILSKLIKYYNIIVDFIKKYFKKRTIQSNDVIKLKESQTEAKKNSKNPDKSREKISKSKASLTRRREAKKENSTIITFRK